MEDVEKVRDICAEYLADKWLDYKTEIKVHLIESGFSNRTYRCTLEKCDPKDVVVKIYGSEFSNASSEFKLQGVVGESLMVQKLASVGLGPELYAAFADGRVEQFIHGRDATNKDFLNDPSLVTCIAKIIVRYHNISMPISKRMKLVDNLIKPCHRIPLQKSIDEFKESDRVHISNLYDFPAFKEIEWIEKYASKVNSKIVFCHHDFRVANIIVKDVEPGDNDRLQLIDYELSAYNYRAFDIAYFLIFLTGFVHKDNEKIVIEYNDNLSPEIEANFLKSYLGELKHIKETTDGFDNFDHLLMETKFFSLPVYILYLAHIKSIANAGSISSLVASYELASVIINTYYKKKEQFVKVYPQVFE